MDPPQNCLLQGNFLSLDKLMVIWLLGGMFHCKANLSCKSVTPPSGRPEKGGCCAPPSLRSRRPLRPASGRSGMFPILWAPLVANISQISLRWSQSTFPLSGLPLQCYAGPCRCRLQACEMDSDPMGKSSTAYLREKIKDKLILC